MMRAMARAALRLYPKAWRQRYGDEVADLIDSRPARMRTVADLLGGAADAWLHHRRIPGARPIRISLAALLPISSYVLLLLWNPGVRDVSSLHGVWARAAELGPVAGHLHRTATTLFIGAGAVALLSVAPLLLTSLTVLRRPSADPVTRSTARRVAVTAAILAVPVFVLCAIFSVMSFVDPQYPVGPLGLSMLGGFLAPILLALVLPLPSLAARAPALVPDVRGSGTQLTVAAILNGLGWLAVATLLLLGLPQASAGFLAAVAAGAVISIGMTALVARSALRQSRGEPGRLLSDPVQPLS